MKYRLDGTTFEAIDEYVRITLGNGDMRVTKKQCPKSIDVSNMLMEMQGYEPNKAQQRACGSACDDARRNRAESELVL